MNCQEVIRFLADYRDGALPWRQRLLFRIHLAFCRHCRRYLASYNTTVQLVQALAPRDEGDSPVPPVPEELIRAVLAARASGANPSTQPAPRPQDG